VRLLVGRGRLDPRDASHGIGAQGHRLLDQLRGARVPQHAVLGKGDDRHVDAPAELLPGGQHRLHPDEPRGGVHVGERLDVQDAVALAVGEGRADGREERLHPVVLLDRPGQVDAARRVGHAVGRVGLQRGITDQGQRVHLVQVQMGVDERLGDQTTRRVQHPRPRRRRQLTGRCERRDHPVGAVHVHHPSGAQPRLGHDERRRSCSR
jgi:hypothetical protein